MWVSRDYQMTAQLCVAKFATPPRENDQFLLLHGCFCIFMNCYEIILVLLLLNTDFIDPDASLRR